VLSIAPTKGNEMNLNDLTYGQIKELSNLIGQRSVKTPFIVGKNYLIRTVTMTISGQVKEAYENFLVMAQAAWIADTGRFSEALIDQNKFNEVEPFKNDCIVSLGAIVDATEISELVTTVK